MTQKKKKETELDDISLDLKFHLNLIYGFN